MSTVEEKLALSEAYSNLLDTVWNMRVHITTGHWIDYGNILNPGTVIRLHWYNSDFWMLTEQEGTGSLNDRWVSSKGESWDVHMMLSHIMRYNLDVEIIFNPHSDH